MRMHSHAQLSVWIGLIVLLLLPQAGQTQIQQRRTTLTYRPQGGDGPPLVQIQIQDSQGVFQNAIFVFDTGLTNMLMTDTLATRLGLHPKPAFRDDGSPLFFEPGKQAQGVDVSIKLGDLPVKGPVAVIKASRLVSRDEPIDGLIGTNFLIQLAIDFDFQKHQITLLYPGNLSADDLKSLDMLDATVLSKATSDPLSFPLAVRLNDQADVNLLIDSGAANTYLPLSVVRQLNLKPLSRHIDESDTLYGTLKTKNVKVRTFAMGPLVLKDQVVDYSEYEQALFPPGIGIDILYRYHLLIDYPVNKLYLKPVSPVPSAPSTIQGTQGKNS